MLRSPPTPLIAKNSTRRGGAHGPPVAEAPFVVQDVRRDRRDDAGDDLRGHRFGLQHCELQRVEDE